MSENDRIKKVKIIFSDIDGTLLNSRRQITDSTRNKILELGQKGYPFVLVSARMPEGVESIQRQIGRHSPIICYSGGLVYDEYRKVLKTCLLELEKALEIKYIMQTEFPHVCCNAYGYDKWIVDCEDNIWVREEEKIIGLMAREGDIKAEFAQYGGVHKFLMIGEQEEVQRTEKRLKLKYPELSIALSKHNYLEVMNGSVRKSAAIRFLCNHLGISLEEAMAFGDGVNDIDMIKAVKYGVAMGNAPEVVKNQADYVTLDHDQEGVLAMLNRLDV